MQIAKLHRSVYISSKSRTLKSKILRPEFFEQLLSSKTVGDIKSFLQGTDYGSFIGGFEDSDIYEGLEDYFYDLFRKVTTGLGKREKEVLYLFFIKRRDIIKLKGEIRKGKDYELRLRKIDLSYIKQLKESVGKLPVSERREARFIIGSFYDLQNLITAVKLRIIYRSQPEDVYPFILPFSYKTGYRLISQILSSSSLSDVSRILKGIIGEFSDFVSFRKAVYRYHIDQINKVWYGYPFKFSIPFALLRLKEIEIKNIKAVYEGKKFRMPDEEIKKMLVGV
ncbi:V-type ATPase subunit [Persephonella sp.]